MQRSADELVRKYLDALAAADVASLLALFTDDAVVHSPLYGPLPATEFFPTLFADTGESHLTLRSVMQGTDESGALTVSFWFHFDWRLPSGTAAPFDVIDIAQLAPDGRIATLHLVYDTVEVRPAFEAETGQPSWRVGAVDKAVKGKKTVGKKARKAVAGAKESAVEAFDKVIESLDSLGNKRD